MQATMNYDLIYTNKKSHGWTISRTTLNTNMRAHIENRVRKASSLLNCLSFYLQSSTLLWFEDAKIVYLSIFSYRLGM